MLWSDHGLAQSRSHPRRQRSKSRLFLFIFFFRSVIEWLEFSTAISSVNASDCAWRVFFLPFDSSSCSLAAPLPQSSFSWISHFGFCSHQSALDYMPFFKAEVDNCCKIIFACIDECVHLYFGIHCRRGSMAPGNFDESYHWKYILSTAWAISRIASL